MTYFGEITPIMYGRNTHFSVEIYTINSTENGYFQAITRINWGDKNRQKIYNSTENYKFPPKNIQFYQMYKNTRKNTQ